MPANDKNSKIKRLRIEAQDRNLPAEARLKAIQRLLKIGASVRNLKVAGTVCGELLGVADLSEDTRKKVLSFRKKIDNGDFVLDSEPEDDGAEVEPSANFNTQLKASLAELLAHRNRNVYINPIPQKHVYFPTYHREYLIETYPDLFQNCSYVSDMPEKVFDDPYNDLPGDLERILNPLFYLGYQNWKETKGVLDKTPDKTSTWYLRYVEEDDVRRWSKIGTLPIPEEQPVGMELRYRQILDGSVLQWETPYSWALWWQIELDGDPKYFMVIADTPWEYLAEFGGLEPRVKAVADEAQSSS